MMDGTSIAILIFVGSVLMIFFTYFGINWLIKLDSFFPAWARRNGFRIIHKETVFDIWAPRGWGQQYYYFIIEDELGKKRSGWITFKLFSGKEIIRWE
jgi:hypothetical protein